MKYLDISKYQPVVKYDLLKSDGIDGVFIRAVSTDKNGLYIDPYFDTHYSGCKAAGVPVGAYIFSYATTAAEVDTELNMLFKRLAGKKFELPIVFDYETKYNSMSKQDRTTLIKYACSVIQKHGYYAMFYTYKNFIDSYLYRDQLTAYDLWIAAYTAVKPSQALYNYGIWQYTSTGNISAVRGNVDLSNVYKDYPAIIKKAGLNGYGGDPEPVPEPLDVKKELIKIKDRISALIDKL